MVTLDTPFSRRGVLRLGGSAVAATGLIGRAAGSESGQVTVNVGYRDATGQEAARTAADEVVHEFGFDALAVVTTPAAARDLAGRSDVRYAERPRQVEAIGPGLSPGLTDGYLGQTLPWGIDRVDAEVAHDAGRTGSGADIAVIDTGIDLTHLDLLGNATVGVTTIGAGRTDTALPGGQDDMGHGTHVAGIAGAQDNSRGVVGVAPAATLHPVKALAATGTGTDTDVAKGLEHVAEQEWDVANMSFGGPQSSVLGDAVEFAHDAGVSLVAAAGNAGPCSDCVSFPAANPEVIAVGTTTRGDELASFSSTGPEVDLVAPGVDIRSSFLANTYLSLTGTSFSAPHVAGAAGHLMADGASNTAARARLQATAEDVGLAPAEGGAGLLDVAGALGLPSGDDL